MTPCLILIITLLSGRCWWITSRSEFGWATLAEIGYSATNGMLKSRMTKLAELPPREQALYWLNRIDRLGLESTERADLAMGAAWILDAPVMELEYVTRLKTFDTMPWLPFSEVSSLEKAMNEFETQSRETRQLLAARASSLESDNVAWWRMRAILLLTHPIFGKDRQAPMEDCREFLQEAQSHDPENSLYDFLAAIRCWEQSAEICFDEPTDSESRESERDDPHHIEVHDADLFAKGLRHWENGQARSVLYGSEMGRPCIPAFLQLTPLSAIDRVRLAQHCQLNRVTMFIARSARWMQVMADEAEANGDTTKALARRLELLHMIEQFLASGESEALDLQAKFMPVFEHFSEHIRHTWQVRPDLIDGKEVAKLDQLMAASTQLAQVYAQAVPSLKSELGLFPDSPIATKHYRWWTLLRALLIAMFATGVIVLPLWCIRGSRCLAKNLLVLPTICVAMFLALAPVVVQHNEAVYRWITGYYRSPALHTRDTQSLLRTHGFSFDGEAVESTGP